MAVAAEVVGSHMEGFFVVNGIPQLPD